MYCFIVTWQTLKFYFQFRLYYLLSLNILFWKKNICFIKRLEGKYVSSLKQSIFVKFEVPRSYKSAYLYEYVYKAGGKIKQYCREQDFKSFFLIIRTDHKPKLFQMSVIPIDWPTAPCSLPWTLCVNVQNDIQAFSMGLITPLQNSFISIETSHMPLLTTLILPSLKL